MRISAETIVDQKKTKDAHWKDFKDKVNENDIFLLLSPNLSEIVYGKISCGEHPYISGNTIYYVDNKIRKEKNGLTLDRIYNQEALFKINETDAFFLNCIDKIEHLHRFFSCFEPKVKY